MRCASQMSQHEIGVQRTTKRLGASQSDVAGRMLKRIRFCTQEPKQSHPPTRRLTCLQNLRESYCYYCSEDVRRASQRDAWITAAKDLN